LQHTATHCNQFTDEKQSPKHFDIEREATHCNKYFTLPYTASHCNTLHHTATHDNQFKDDPQSPKLLKIDNEANHCNSKRQHSATNFNTLQPDQRRAAGPETLLN